MKRNTSALEDWVNSGLKGLAVVTCGLVAYSYQELNGTMRELTSVTRAIELRVTAMEADRNAKLEQYKTTLSDVQDLKVQMSQVAIRIQTLADFVARAAPIKEQK